MKIVLENVTKEFPVHANRFLSKKAGTAGTMPENMRALKDISFQLNAGDVLGIVGHNGSGKSTLLRIISGIIPPTSGTINYTGTLASILDVGTGFHPDLSGTDNVYLSCKIHGLTKAQVTSIFDSILQFSEIGNYIHVPVKYYSSGMYLKLAFAIILHIDVDILLMDEVLNVGDGSFRLKCTQKVEELISRGKIALISSHDLGSISMLCNKCLVLEKGEIVHFGETQTVLQNYMEAIVIKNVEETRRTLVAEQEEETKRNSEPTPVSENTEVLVDDFLKVEDGKELQIDVPAEPVTPTEPEAMPGSELQPKVEIPKLPSNLSQYHSNIDLFKNEAIHVKNLRIYSKGIPDAEKLYVGEELCVDLVFEKYDPEAEIDFLLVVKDYLYMPVFLLNTRMAEEPLIPAAKGAFKITFSIPGPFLNKGFFTADLLLVLRRDNTILKEYVNALVFHIHNNKLFFEKYGGGQNFPGPLMVKIDTKISGG